MKQAIEKNLLKTGLERRVYHQYQVDPCAFYKKDSVTLTYVNDCVILSHKQETILSLIESLNNGPESMYWHMHEIYQIILEVISRKIDMGHSNYHYRTWWGKL